MIRVAGVALELPVYQPDRVHSARMSAAMVRSITRRLLEMSHTQRAAIPAIHPGRVDIVPAGTLILAVILNRLQLSEVLVSEHDILDGIAWSLVDR